jgi:DNA (cytosine-5)-methyltransferase 1
MRRPIAIDLFSGCGGMSLGLEAAGFDIAASVELDPIHAIVHHVNFPYSVSICQDINHLNPKKLIAQIKQKGFIGEIDLIAGGPPCQGFSHIGKRQLDDPRNSLVFEYVRIIKDIKPKYFIFENVPGIASGEHRQFLDELIREFKRIGYAIAQPIKILDASLFGAPQKRKRLIIIGSRKDVKPAHYPVENHQESEAIFNTVGDAIADLANIPAFLGQDRGIDGKKLDYSSFRKSFALHPSGDYALCHKRKTDGRVWGHIASNHTAKSTDRFLLTEPGTVEKTSRFFKLADSGLCNTLRAGTTSDKGAHTAPRPIHYREPRCITIREAARLHTFPDWFQFHRTIWHGFREIGNAVIPMLSKALGDEIMECLNIDVNTLEIRDLPEVDSQYLTYNMGQASAYWDVPNDVIPKRKRGIKNAA